MLILLDNGSKRPEATKNLRRLANALCRRLGERVHPVSLLHSAAIDPEQLDGTPADTLEPFLVRQTKDGQRDFVITPLFFGRSRALDVFIPEVVERVQAQLSDQLGAQSGRLNVRLTDVLCPLPEGGSRLVDILADHVSEAVAEHDLTGAHVVVVDHGSPIPAVTAVRRWLANALAQRLEGKHGVCQAVMERRPGADYDFNGKLLEEILAEKGSDRQPRNVVLAMQFISPGRHAGAGGDIAEIARAAMDSHSGLRIFTTRLMGEHPLFLEILYDRVSERLERPGTH
jgi:sirohydrochlorin ferrochelatase